MRSLDNSFTEIQQIVDEIGETEEQLDQNKKDVESLVKSIENFKDANRVGGDAVDQVVRAGLVNLKKEWEKFKANQKQHDDLTPPPSQKEEYNEEAKRLNARKRAILAEARTLKKAENDSRTARRWLRKKISDYEMAKKKLEKKQVKLEIKYRNLGGNFVSSLGSIRDRCQRLADNSAVSDETLISYCSKFYTGSNVSDLVELGIQPIQLPEFRQGHRVGPYGGELVPFPTGSVRPRFRLPLPFGPRFEMDQEIPEVDGSGPVDPETGRRIR